MQRADLVAIGITEIGEIDRTVPKSRRVFTRGSAICDARGMPGVSLLRRLHAEPNRAAIAVRCGLPVDWRRDRKVSRRADVEIADSVECLVIS